MKFNRKVPVKYNYLLVYSKMDPQVQKKYVSVLAKIIWDKSLKVDISEMLKNNVYLDAEIAKGDHGGASREHFINDIAAVPNTVEYSRTADFDINSILQNNTVQHHEYINLFIMRFFEQNNKDVEGVLIKYQQVPLIYLKNKDNSNNTILMFELYHMIDAIRSDVQDKLFYEQYHKKQIKKAKQSICFMQ